MTTDADEQRDCCDCEQSKHANCDGTTWDNDADECEAEP